MSDAAKQDLLKSVVVKNSAAKQPSITGSGNSAFVEHATAQGTDVIRDFDVEQGDVLDFSGLIRGFDCAKHSIDDFLSVRDFHGGSVISVDVSGSGHASNSKDIVALEGIQSLDLQQMLEAGLIYVDFDFS